jgi:hypothetical protein
MRAFRSAKSALFLTFFEKQELVVGRVARRL